MFEGYLSCVTVARGGKGWEDRRPVAGEDKIVESVDY
jgi:hypothetical protein